MSSIAEFAARLDVYRAQVEAFETKMWVQAAMAKPSIIPKTFVPPPMAPPIRATPWLIDRILYDTFLTIPLNFEVYERGGMICMVRAELELDGNKVMCKNKPIAFPWRLGYNLPLEVRLCDMAGAVYLTLACPIQIDKNFGLDTVTLKFDTPVFTLS